MTVGKHSFHQFGDDTTVDIGSFSSIGIGVEVHFPDEHPCVADRKLVSTFPFHERWGIGNYPKSGKGKRENSNVVIGNDVWVGAFSWIMSGVTIGDGAIVGAHSVVAKDVEPYTVVVGNPIQVKRHRYYTHEIEKLLRIKWWDWDDEIIKSRLADFFDIEKFVEKYDTQS